MILFVLFQQKDFNVNILFGLIFSSYIQIE